MHDRYSVCIKKAEHVFCSGHFITLTDTVCEPIHGHNWTVSVEIDGQPNAHGMVIDFILLRDHLSLLIKQLDHKMLLPTKNSFLQVKLSQDSSSHEEVHVHFSDRRWIFPADECVLLPVANTTAEWIASWIGNELLQHLNEHDASVSGVIRVAVDECLGQSGVWERDCTVMSR